MHTICVLSSVISYVPVGICTVGIYSSFIELSCPYQRGNVGLLQQRQATNLPSISVVFIIVTTLADSLSMLGLITLSSADLGLNPTLPRFVELSVNSFLFT